MKEEIEKLEATLKELKRAYEKEEELSYRNQPHINFAKGDIVTNGDIVGRVIWTSNISLGLTDNSGYMGVEIINGRGGFGSYRRDEFAKDNDLYYTGTHSIRINLTGEEAEELKRCLGPRNVNPSKIKTTVLDLLQELRRLCDIQ